ncbi:MAG: hypothetical protein NO126_01125 [Sulfolobales archaeon]|nr:hypothetical protein [Sulfolobales archaeon]
MSSRRTYMILGSLLVALIVLELILVYVYHINPGVNVPFLHGSQNPQGPFLNPSDTFPSLPTHVSAQLLELYYNFTYNPSLNLVSSKPYSDVYSLQDNLLAAAALYYLNDSRWHNVMNALKDNLTPSPFLVLLNDSSFNWNFTYLEVEYVKEGPYVLAYVSYVNGSEPLEWYEFPNYSFLFAIYEAERGHVNLAQQVFSRVIANYWTGYGFKGQNRYYSSADLALAIIAWKVIASYNQTFADRYLPLMKTVYNVSSKLQSPIGGFFSEYEVVNGTIVPLGDVNTETTSLFTIAFLMGNGTS